jgi:hypothetical protein
MTQKTGNEGRKIIGQIKLEEDHHFIMVVEIFAHYNVMMIGQVIS